MSSIAERNEVTSLGIPDFLSRHRRMVFDRGAGVGYRACWNATPAVQLNFLQALASLERASSATACVSRKLLEH
jgi:hypothetical protein